MSNIGICQTKPTMFYSDNPNTISMVKNPKYHKWIKHIDTKYSFIREKWETKQIELPYVHTMTRLMICWLNHCPKISINGYETIWGWLFQTFIFLHEWVGEMSYMPIKQMIHMMYEWEYWVHIKVCSSMNHSIGLEKNGQTLHTWFVLFSCFMFLYLSSFVTMFKTNFIVVIVVTYRRKKLQRCKSNVI